MSTLGLAVVTGASSGIGLELARCCAKAGYNLVLAANEPELEDAAKELRASGTNVEWLTVDLATREGVADLCDIIGSRSVHALLANAGHGLGHAFLDQDFEEAEHVIDTNDDRYVASSTTWAGQCVSGGKEGF